MKRAVALSLIYFALAARGDEPSKIGPQEADKESGYLEEVINRCLADGGLRPIKDAKTGKTIQDAKLGTPQVAVADAGKLKATLTANRKLLTVRVRNSLVGIAKLCEPPGRPVWLYVLRTLGEVNGDDLALEMAATLAAQFDLPRATDDGMLALRTLVGHCVEAGGIRVGPKDKQGYSRLLLADAGKLQATVAAQKALVTPALLDTAVATSYRLDHSVLLRAIGTELDDRRALAFASYFTGRLRRRDDRLEDAVREFDDAARRFADLKEAPWRAQALTGLAGAHEQLHELDTALRHYREALRILRRVHEGKHRDVALLLHALVRVYTARGEYQRALFFYVQAMPIVEALPDFPPADGAAFIHEYGFIARHLGEPTEALENYDVALKIFRHVYGKQHATVATCLKNMGHAYLDLDERVKAQQCFTEALDIRRALYGPDHPSVAHTLLDLSLARARDGQHAAARQNQEQALAIFRKTYGPRHPLVATALQNIGHVCLLQKDDIGALAHFDRALQVLAIDPDKAKDIGQLTSTDFRSDREVMHLLARRGSLLERQAVDDPARQLSHLRAARRAYEVAAGVLDRLRADMSGKEDKALTAAGAADLFPAWIGVCRQLYVLEKKPELLEAAFAIAERGTARAFLESLGGPVARAVAGVSGELRQQELQLLARLQRLDAQYGREAGLPADQRDPERARAIWKQRDETDGELQRLRARLEKDHPQYAALLVPRPCTLAEARASLGRNEVAVFYLLGSQASYGVLLEPRPGPADASAGLTVFPLPAAETIGNRVQLAIDADKLMQPASFRRLGADLYTLLLAPVADRIKGKDLVIVPSGDLCLLPFGALVARDRYLIEGHSIRYAPSLTALHLLKQWQEKRQVPDLPLYAVGDPVYGPSDMRSNKLKLTDASREALSEYQGEPAAGLPRLQHSGTEVAALGRLFDVPTEHLPAGRDATEARIKLASSEGRLARYRRLHFATHGLVGRQPALALSLVGNTDEDGFLQIDEVMNLKLNADLVVLSACQSGRGRLHDGEGVRGLARAFLFAGSRGVVCSLWSVDDAETAGLMTALYGHLKANQLSGDALRSVQLAMIKGGKAPFYWAPFILIGE